MIERGSCVPSSMPRRCASEADEVRRDADIVQILEDELGNPVVEHPLAVDHLVLLGIEGGRIILEVLDQGPGLRTLVEDFGLAFVNATAAIHRDQPGLEEIHELAVAPSVPPRPA